MRSSPSTTHSTGSPGSSTAWSSIPSEWSATCGPRTASSSRTDSCWPSSTPASSAQTPTVSCSETRCARGTKSATSASSSAPTPKSPHGSTRPHSRRSSTSRPRSPSSTPHSNVSAASSRRRNQFMPETATHVGSGKVRELYALDDERLLLVASDRISTFDVVLPTEIPDKGRVLTGLSGFWFARTRSLCPNHLIALRPDGRSTECRRLRMLPIECVVRGYLSGSAWNDYRRSGEVCGHRLPHGLRESERLPEPIFTPATKAQNGHDQNITRDEAAALVGAARLGEVERLAL